MFLKECKYTEIKVIRHINDNLSDFSSDDDDDDESDKNKLELVRLVFQKILDITSQTGNAHKKACCIFKTMFKIIKIH